MQVPIRLRPFMGNTVYMVEKVGKLKKCLGLLENLSY